MDGSVDAHATAPAAETLSVAPSPSAQEPVPTVWHDFTAFTVMGTAVADGRRAGDDVGASVEHVPSTLPGMPAVHTAAAVHELTSW